MCVSSENNKVVVQGQKKNGEATLTGRLTNQGSRGRWPLNQCVCLCAVPHVLRFGTRIEVFIIMRNCVQYVVSRVWFVNYCSTSDEGSITATLLSTNNQKEPFVRPLTSQMRPSSPVTARHKHDTRHTLPVMNSESVMSSTVSSSTAPSVTPATSLGSPPRDVSVPAPVHFLFFCSAYISFLGYSAMWTWLISDHQ